MKHATIVGMCRGFELGHETFGMLLVIFGHVGIGIGVALMGCGWWAARRQWERVENNRVWAAIRGTAPREKSK